MSKILCVDFDGVLHSYTSGWQGAGVINDPPVIGAMDWLHRMWCTGNYEVHIYSSRSKDVEGIKAMQTWLLEWLEAEQLGENAAIAIVDDLHFPTQKPPAYLTIDDRAICFRGTFPSLQELDNFTPWNK